jgi:outer membrane protein
MGIEMFKKISLVHAATGLCAYFCLSDSAYAQAIASAQVQAGSVLQSDQNNGDQSEDHFILGAGASYMPAYEGSRKYRVLPVPVIDVAWGPVFANLKDGIGVQLSTDVFRVGVSGTVMQGYRARDVPRGVRKLSYGIGARAFASVTQMGATLSVGATKGVALGNKGVIADASLSYAFPVSDRLTFTPAVQTTWANGRYNDRYFGINAAQSLASGRPEYRAHGGFDDVSALVGATYLINDHLIFAASGGVTRVVGNVQRSPLVERRTQPVGFVSLAYRF